MKTLVNILFGIFAGITIASFILAKNQTEAIQAQIIEVKHPSLVKVDGQKNNLPKLKVPASIKSASLR